MERFVLADEHRGADSLAVTLVSMLCALAGLCLATASIAADGAIWLVAGVVLGALGPLLIRLVARHRSGEVTRGLSQAGLPYTATTTDRSRLFSDQTPMAVLAQSDMISKSTGS